MGVPRHFGSVALTLVRWGSAGGPLLHRCGAAFSNVELRAVQGAL